MSSVNKAFSTHYIGDANKQSRRYTDECVPEVLALKISGLVNLYSGLDIVRMVAHRKCPVLDGAKVYFAVGIRFRLVCFRATAVSMETDNHWQQLEMIALVKEIYSHQLALAISVMDKSKKKADAKKSIEDWIGLNKSTVSATEQLLNELWTTDANDLSMIVFASRQTKTMTENNS
jgi:glutamate dehydrogenase